jgi:DNA-binding NtrC family response regulator
MPNHTILVVDDEKLILDSITNLLMGEGYEVSSASNGQEALVLLGSKSFDLVISDLKLPDGIGGMEILQKSKAISSSTKVLILTAYADLLHAQKAKREGVDEFLSKPYDMEDLLHTVKRLLER